MSCLFLNKSYRKSVNLNNMNDLSCHLFTSCERALDSKLNGCLCSRLSVLNGHLSSLTHLAEMIIAILWYQFEFQNNK